MEDLAFALEAQRALEQSQAQGLSQQSQVASHSQQAPEVAPAPQGVRICVHHTYVKLHEGQPLSLSDSEGQT